MEINIGTIDTAFNLYRAAFEDLAEQEDKLEAMKQELEDYKEGSAKHQEAMRRVQDFERAMIAYQRKFRMAALELDRVKTFVAFLDNKK